MEAVTSNTEAPEPVLDPRVCERARQARDPRFDGRFYVGVLTTGIYCRPICPVQPPRPDNVRFFPSAAAAEEAGLRACLRCRPECAPGSPAWLGTGATVRRALRLIEEGALDGGSVEELGARLGIGERHLRRLFDRWLGAAPSQVARTRRLRLAKQLTTDTELPMAEVALASGFGSVRRFNEVVRRCWGKTPTELRRGGSRREAGSSSRRSKSSKPASLCLQLSFREPYDWSAMLSFLRPRATPGVERVDGVRYLRTFEVDGEVGWMEISRAPVPGALEVQLGGPPTRALLVVTERLRGLFDLYADPDEIGRHLSTDSRLEAPLRRHPGIRVPGAWDGFELAVRAVLGQQVTVKAATTLAGRLVARHGTAVEEPLQARGLTHVFPSAERLAAASLEGLGLPSTRARALRSLAEAVLDGALDLRPTSDPEECRRQLLALPGIGPWTAEYVALRLLRDPDALPAGDLVLRQKLGSRDRIASERQVTMRAEPWRPWRAYGAMLLWLEALEDRP